MTPTELLFHEPGEIPADQLPEIAASLIGQPMLLGVGIGGAKTISLNQGTITSAQAVDNHVEAIVTLKTGEKVAHRFL